MINGENENRDTNAIANRPHTMGQRAVFSTYSFNGINQWLEELFREFQVTFGIWMFAVDGIGGGVEPGVIVHNNNGRSAS